MNGSRLAIARRWSILGADRCESEWSVLFSRSLFVETVGSRSNKEKPNEQLEPNIYWSMDPDPSLYTDSTGSRRLRSLPSTGETPSSAPTRFAPDAGAATVKPGIDAQPSSNFANLP